MDVSSDFKDLLSALNEVGARYLIARDFAFAFHNRPRFTNALEIWVEPPAQNADATYRALAQFGAPLDQLAPAALANEDVVFQIVAPLRIDITTSITGVSFSDAWESKVLSTYGGVPVAIIGRNALLANKRATGRAQDLADIESLERSSD